MKNKIILYIAMSLDGFIARENGNIGWLTRYENSNEDYGFKEMYERIGTVFVGGKTYRQIEDAYKGKEAYVFTKSIPKSKEKNIHFISGDVKAIVDSLKLCDDKDIWLVGGAELANQFMSNDLIEEYIITIVPILLGRGIPLYQGQYSDIILKLSNVKHFDNGLVQLRYVRHG